MKWVSDEEGRETALALYRDSIAAERRLIVPAHFPGEVANAIWRKVSRGLLQFEEGLAAIADFANYRTARLAPVQLFSVSFTLARSLRLPAIYDSLYVALAQIVGCELWTADLRLANAVAGAGLPVDVRLLSTYSGF